MAGRTTHGDWGWVLHGRPRLNAGMRLTTRAHELLSRGGAATGPLRIGAAALSTVADLALVRRLRHSSASETALHVGVDAADLALWGTLSTTAGYSQLATAMNTSHPMAIEAGARYGPIGLAVPLLNATVAGVVARLRGRPVMIVPWIWQVAAGLGGIGLARYARRRRSRVLAVHEAELGAQLVRAELTGLNEVSLGLGNVFDELQRAISLMVLSSHRPDDAAPPTSSGLSRCEPSGSSAPSGARVPAEWKANVAELTRERHVYLVDQLVGWQQEHNRQPDLHAVVSLTIDPGLAPVILEAPDGRRLRSSLDALQLRGRHSVIVRSRSANRLVLGIGDHAIEIVTATPELTLGFDPLPGGFAWSALWLAAAAPRDGVRPAAALGPAAAALGLMRWSHRRAQRGVSDPDAAIIASSVLSMVSAVVQTRWVGSSHIPNPVVPGGIPRVPASLALRGHSFVTELCRPTATPASRTLAWATVAVTIAVCRRLTPPPRPWREFLAELTWVGMGAAIARAFTDGIDHESAEREQVVARDVQRRIDQSSERGRAAAHAAATALLAEAQHDFERHADHLDDDVRLEVQRRLQDCADALT